MCVALYPQDYIIGSQADFDQNISSRHLTQQIDGVILVHHVYSMPDALSMSALDRFADMKAQAFRRHQAHSQLTRVQADVYFGIDAVQVVEHLHVQLEIVHGNIPIFWHHQIQAYTARIRLRQFEAEKNLREDHLARQAAQYLIQIANLNCTSWIRFHSPTLEDRPHFALVVIETLARSCDDLLETTAQQLLTHTGEVIVPSQLRAKLSGLNGIRGIHQLEILKTVFRRTRCCLGKSVSGTVMSCQRKLVEGCEEMIVPRFFAWLPIAHGPRIDNRVVEHVIAIRTADRGLARVLFAGIIAWRGDEN